MWCTGKETGRSASNSFLKTRGFLVFKIRSDKSRKQCLGATQPRFRLLGKSPKPREQNNVLAAHFANAFCVEGTTLVDRHRQVQEKTVFHNSSR